MEDSNVHMSMQMMSNGTEQWCPVKGRGCNSEVSFNGGFTVYPMLALCSSYVSLLPSKHSMLQTIHIQLPAITISIESIACTMRGKSYVQCAYIPSTHTTQAHIQYISVVAYNTSIHPMHISGSLQHQHTSNAYLR